MNKTVASKSAKGRAVAVSESDIVVFSIGNCAGTLSQVPASLAVWMPPDSLSKREDRHYSMFWRAPRRAGLRAASLAIPGAIPRERAHSLGASAHVSSSTRLRRAILHGRGYRVFRAHYPPEREVSNRRIAMSKGEDKKKEVKKQPTKTMKEKKAEKKAKKESQK